MSNTQAMSRARGGNGLPNAAKGAMFLGGLTGGVNQDPGTDQPSSLQDVLSRLQNSYSSSVPLNYTPFDENAPTLTDLPAGQAGPPNPNGPSLRQQQNTAEQQALALAPGANAAAIAQQKANADMLNEIARRMGENPPVHETPYNPLPRPVHQYADIPNRPEMRRDPAATIIGLLGGLALPQAAGHINASVMNAEQGVNQQDFKDAVQRYQEQQAQRDQQFADAQGDYNANQQADLFNRGVGLRNAEADRQAAVDAMMDRVKAQYGNTVADALGGIDTQAGKAEAAKLTAQQRREEILAGQQRNALYNDLVKKDADNRTKFQLKNIDAIRDAIKQAGQTQRQGAKIASDQQMSNADRLAKQHTDALKMMLDLQSNNETQRHNQAMEKLAQDKASGKVDLGDNPYYQRLGKDRDAINKALSDSDTRIGVLLGQLKTTPTSQQPAIQDQINSIRSTAAANGMNLQQIMKRMEEMETTAGVRPPSAQGTTAGSVILQTPSYTVRKQ